MQATFNNTINGQTVNDLDLELKIAKVNALIAKLKLEDKIEIIVKTEKTSSDKTLYIVTLEGDIEVEFESTDEKSAKYRAYRIGRDGSKDRASGLKVVSLRTK